MNKRQLILLSLLTIVCLNGCGVKQEKIDSEGKDQINPVVITPSVTSEPTLTFTPEPTLTPSVTPVVILDPEPIKVKFFAEDGVELEGLYFPAAENPAPIIVLVHWSLGDMTEWEPISVWLQNRGQLVRSPDYNNSWLSSDWFPENRPEFPLGVFIFTLRGCGEGCSIYSPEDWLKDIEAAMLEVTQLQGVDGSRIMTAGASIGADGALYGCAWINQQLPGSCQGSFSLSPASLLTIPYDEIAAGFANADPPIPVYCLFGLRDDASVETCRSLEGIEAVDYGYIENHGLELLQPGQSPDPLELLLDFIQSSLAGEGN